MTLGIPSRSRRMAATLRLITGIVLSALGIVANQTTASATSYTGAVEYTYEVCNEGNGLPPKAFVQNFVNGVSGALGIGASDPNACFNAFTNGVVSALEGTTHAPGAAANTVLGAPNSVDVAVETIWNVTGKVFGQVETLTGMKLGASVELSGPSPGVAYRVGDSRGRAKVSTVCIVTSCVLGTPPSGGSDTANKFQWIDDGRLYWYPSDNDGRLDGVAIMNLYGAVYKPHEAWDFYASSQAASATPQNGHRITKMLATAAPDSKELQVVEADPISVAKYGSAGSFSLGASLDGEAKFGNFGGGASFNVGRTWNFAEGTVGGGLLSDGSHYTQWQSGNKTGSTTAKSAVGVETWKAPTETGVTIWYSASAWVRD